jgi:D-alanyl-D-alanine-carboxypeptidase/D-alanyl-D-alanine-endopeptidase
MKLMVRLLSVFLLSGLASALTFAQPPTSSASNFDVASFLGQQLYERSGATGMVMVAVHGNQVFIEGFGQTAPGSGRRPDAHSTVRLCSLTKIFTSDVLAKLTLDKTVRLDDPLQKYAPAGVIVPSRKQPITLLNLATHTAGLYREVGYPPDGTPHFTYPDYNLRWQWLPKQHLRSTPGTFAAYSNVGFDLLSDALSAASHKPYANLLHERTLAPLRMWDTTFYPNPAQCGRLMVGTRDQSPCTVTANTEGSAGLYSTPTDMARWLKYLVAAPGSPAQPREAQAAYLQPGQYLRQIGLNYAGNPSALGLGWVHLLTPDHPSHLVEKDGGGAGYLTYIAVHPASHSAIFVAMTIGRNGYHANLFNSSNSILLQMVGAPPIPLENGKPGARLSRTKGVRQRGLPANRAAAAPQQKAGRQQQKTAKAHAQPARKQQAVKQKSGKQQAGKRHTQVRQKAAVPKTHAPAAQKQKPQQKPRARAKHKR